MLHTRPDGTAYWAAEYLTPGSDAWKKRVFGFKLKDQTLNAKYQLWSLEIRNVVADYGKLPLSAASAMLGALAQLCARSPLVEPGDFVSLFAEGNVQRVAAEMRDDGKSDASVGNFVSYCRGFAKHYVDAAPQPTQAAKKRSSKPYPPEMVEAYWRLFSGVACARTRFEASALLCGVIGAGADARDLRFWRTTDIVDTADGVDVIWNGATHRTVPIAEPWATRLVELLAEAPTVDMPNWVLRGRRDNRLVPSVFDRVPWPLERFKVTRGRTTWLVDRLSTQVHLAELKRLSGASTYFQIGEAADHLELPHRDDLDVSFRIEANR